MAVQPELVLAMREAARLKAEKRQSQKALALRLYREQPELNRSQIAQRVGVNPSTITDWLRQNEGESE